MKGLTAIVERRLSALAPLGASACALIAGLQEVHRAPAGAEIVGDTEPLHPGFLLSGWGARVRHLADGRRQIVGFVLPGEGMGICARPQPLALCPVVALTPVTLVSALPVARAAFGHTNAPAEDLAIALHLSAALDEGFLIDQIVRLGRQTALERVAHLFLELHYRQHLSGLSANEAFVMPLTQEQLGDATGLSAVHVNRTLQQLRRDGLLELAHGRGALLKPILLEAIAEWRRPEVSRFMT